MKFKLYFYYSVENLDTLICALKEKNINIKYIYSTLTYCTYETEINDLDDVMLIAGICESKNTDCAIGYDIHGNKKLVMTENLLKNTPL